MKIFSTIFILLFLCSCANTRPWTKQEKIAAGFFLLAHSADAITTSQFDKYGIIEVNPILDEHPSDAEIGIYFCITSAITLLFCDICPELRKYVLYGYGAINTHNAINNYDTIQNNKINK